MKHRVVPAVVGLIVVALILARLRVRLGVSVQAPSRGFARRRTRLPHGSPATRRPA